MGLPHRKRGDDLELKCLNHVWVYGRPDFFLNFLFMVFKQYQFL